MYTYRYCKKCGHRIAFRSMEELGYCPVCDEEVLYEDTSESRRPALEVCL